jgi:hypothetical protein
MAKNGRKTIAKLVVEGSFGVIDAVEEGSGDHDRKVGSR